MTRLSATFRRLSGALLVSSCLAGPAGAADGLTLRGDIVAERDALTLGDLVDNAPASLADTALFRAPALGQAGTIQTRRIVQALEGLGLGAVETGGRLQVTITRASRVVGPGEIEAALRRVLAEKHGYDAASTGITFDGPQPSLVLPPALKGEVVPVDLAIDRRTRRLIATIAVSSGSSDPQASARVSGAIVDMVEVAVVSRSLDRGETVRAGDLTVERRPREVVPADAIFDGTPALGRVARRAIGPGALVRAGDLAKPEAVGRGDIVTAVYETPGIALSMRVRAQEAGAVGDVISVVNPTSRKALQATIVAPGKVSVRPGAAERVVATNAATRLP